jgi:hypothetical protein
MVVNGLGSTVPDAGIHSYLGGTEVQLSAVPEPGNQFVEWRSGGFPLSTSNPLGLTMDSHRTVEAVFIPIVLPPEQHSVNIVVVGTGQTGPEPGSYTFNDGDQLTVQAIPETGWAFSHWEGSASGTANPLTISVSSDLTLTAVFVPIPVVSAAVPIGAGLAVLSIIAFAAFRKRR